MHPIDYANASPDVALTSLHYYFPWAIKTLLKWCTFCTVTGRRPPLDLDTRRYFEIGDREDLSYEEKLAGYRGLIDDYFETDRYREFCDSHLSHVDELMLDWVSSSDFDAPAPRHRPGDVSRPTSRSASSPTCVGCVGQWVSEQGRQPAWD